MKSQRQFLLEKKRFRGHVCAGTGTWLILWVEVTETVWALLRYVEGSTNGNSREMEPASGWGVNASSLRESSKHLMATLGNATQGALIKGHWLSNPIKFCTPDPGLTIPLVPGPHPWALEAQHNLHLK